MRGLAIAAVLAALMCPAAGRADPAPLTGKAYARVAAAYEALNRNDLAAAEREARTAQRLSPDHPGAVRLLVDVLARRGNRDGALAVADEAVARGMRDADLLAQRGYLRAAAGMPAAALEDFRAVLGRPDVAPDRRRGLALAAADQAATLGRHAEVLDLLAPYAGEKGYAVAARRGFALFALERHADAKAAFGIAADTAADPAERRTALKGLAQSVAAIGERDTVRALVERIVAEAPTCDADLIYLLLRIGDDGPAIAMADAPPCAGGLTPALQVDLGYAAKRLARNREAVGRFARGLDGYRTGDAPDPAAEFGLRREIDALEREFGFTASATSLLGRSPEGGGDSTQFIAEMFWQPEGIGFRNGKIFQTYARLSNSAPGTLGGSEGWTDDVQAAVGVRYKPLAHANLVVAAERHFALGPDATDDWLVRAGYSGGFNLDLQPVEESWTFEQHYAEIGYFVEQGRTVMSGDVRYGVAAKLFGLENTTAGLYAGGAFSYDSAEREPLSAGLGPGLSLRHWFRETEHRAPASVLNLDVGYRFPVTDSDRIGGFYIQLHLSY